MTLKPQHGGLNYLLRNSCISQWHNTKNNKDGGNQEGRYIFLIRLLLLKTYTVWSSCVYSDLVDYFHTDFQIFNYSPLEDYGFQLSIRAQTSQTLRSKATSAGQALPACSESFLVSVQQGCLLGTFSRIRFHISVTSQQPHPPGRPDQGEPRTKCRPKQWHSGGK